jgi:STE24 endopeptidase
MDVGNDRDPHRRRATLPRAALVVVGLAAAAGVAVAAYVLLDTDVPSLELPAVDPGSVFSPAELDRMEAYRRLPRWLWIASILIELAVLALLAWKGRDLARWFQRRARGRVRTGLLVGLVIVGSVWLATLPVAAVGHWWRRRYGLSEQSYAAWLGDQTVSLAVLAVLVSIAVGGALFLAGRFGRRWWIPGGAALAALGVLYVALQPVAIEPLFNRFEPIRDSVLAARIEALGDELGVHIDRVEVADASRRTTAANALVTGIGPTRRIALYDTLLDGRFSQDEIVAVAAHELAHVQRDHVWKGAAWFALLAIPGLAIVAFVIGRRGDPRDPGLVPLALLCAFVLSLAALPATNALSRRYEAEADWLALTATRDPQAVSGLVRGLALASLGDPDPPGWSRMLLGTHPSSLERITMAEAFASRR